MEPFWKVSSSGGRFTRGGVFSKSSVLRPAEISRWRCHDPMTPWPVSAVSMSPHLLQQALWAMGRSPVPMVSHWFHIGFTLVSPSNVFSCCFFFFFVSSICYFLLFFPNFFHNFFLIAIFYCWFTSVSITYCHLLLIAIFYYFSLIPPLRPKLTLISMNTNDIYQWYIPMRSNAHLMSGSRSPWKLHHAPPTSTNMLEPWQVILELRSRPEWIGNEAVKFTISWISW
jgi:hypothetical protein